MKNLIGQVLSQRYRVMEYIGRGGMADVYKVWDQKRSVELAMKVLREDLAEDKVFLRRFTREGQTLAKLSHPSIVRFYGLEQNDEIAFMLMDFIDGTTLRKEIFKSNKRGVSVHFTLKVMRAVCSALFYAHSQGMVHCDIKPGNILISQNGSIFLTDFGISRMSDAATMTMVGMGTPAYMAPEQAKGFEPKIQTDIYALGVVLFEMLTGGERPFVGEQGETTGSLSERIRWEQINLEPPSPRQYNPNISPELEAVVLKCMQKNPEDRYQNVLEFLQDLETALDNPSDIESEGVQDPSIENQIEDAAGTVAGPKSGTKKWLIPAIAAACVIFVICLFSIAGGAGLAGLFRNRKPATQSAAIYHSRTPTERMVSFSSTPAPEQKEVVLQPTQTARVVKPSATSEPARSATRTHTSQPTRTATSRPPTATKKPSSSSDPDVYFPLSGCAHSIVHLHDWVLVSKDGEELFMRSNSDNHPTNNIIDNFYIGELAEVINGPECSYGWLMWEIRKADGTVGWVSESDGDTFWLDVQETRKICSSSYPESMVAVGDEAFVAILPPVSNRVRNGAGTSYEQIGSINPGERIKIMDGPECNDGYIWWYVRSLKTGLEGWTAESDNSSQFLIPD